MTGGGGRPFIEFAELAATAIEFAGVAVIVLGIVLATANYVWAGWGARSLSEPYDAYRANLGRGILLGLELLVGADIIATVTAPLTFSTVGLLAAVVLIRTFLSFSLETEIEGEWPWRRRSSRRPENAPETV